MTSQYVALEGMSAMDDELSHGPDDAAASCAATNEHSLLLFDATCGLTIAHSIAENHAPTANVAASDDRKGEFCRDEMLIAVKKAATLHSELTSTNCELQATLATLLVLRRGSTLPTNVQANPAIGTRNAATDAAAWHRALALVSEEKQRAAAEREGHDGELAVLQRTLDIKSARALAISNAFDAFKLEVAAGAAHSRTGVRLSHAELRLIAKRESKRAVELSRAQFSHIHAVAEVSGRSDVGTCELRLPLDVITQLVIT